jgi:hypothetical protein
MTISAPHWLCYHCIHTLLMVVNPRRDDHAQSQDGCIVKRHGSLTAYDVEKVARTAKASALRVRTAAGDVLIPPPAAN